MTTITIDDVSYELDMLSDDAKAQIQALQATDRKIAEAQQDLAILQTARNAYAMALQDLLPATDSGADINPGDDRDAAE